MRVLTVSLAAVMAVFAQNPPNPQLASISGTLLGRDGTPAANTRVHVIGLDDVLSSLLNITQTDDAGRYRVVNLRAGRYAVAAGRIGAPTYFPGVADQAGARILDVIAGQAVTGIDFRMVTPPGVRLRGRVVRQDSQGAIVPAAPAGASGPPFQIVGGAAGSATVRLLGGSLTPGTSAGQLIAPDGSFEFTNLPPGTYQATITPGLAAARYSVTLADRDITDFLLVVPMMVAVPGTATVEGGGPVPRAQLSFTAGPTQVQINPAFTAQLQVGEQTVTLNGLPPQFTLKSITSGGVDLASKPFKVEPGMGPLRIVLSTTTPSPWVRITGRVVGRGEWHLLPNFNIILPQLASSPEVVFYLDGTFELPKTLPVDHQIRVSGIGGPGLLSTVSASQKDPVLYVPAAPASTAGLTPDNGTPGVRVSGRIIGRAKASKGARVRLHHTTFGETFTAPIYMDGSFEFPRVPAGTYAAEVFPPVPGATASTLMVGETNVRDVRITVPDAPQ